MFGIFKKKEEPKLERAPWPDTVKVTSRIKARFDVVDLVSTIIFNILGYENINLTIYSNDTVLNRLSKDDIQFQALLEPSAMNHTYTLLVRSTLGKSELMEVLCHEMCHLDQYERGDLKKIGTNAYWKGKRYDNSISYWERPWEKEAQIKQVEFSRKYKQYSK